MLHVVLLFLALANALKLIHPTDIITKIILVLFALCFPAFMMLPGIIYKDFKASYHGFTMSQLKYSLFLGLTLGVGPIFMFFKDHDSRLRKQYENY